MVYWGAVNQSSLGIGWKPWETLPLAIDLGQRFDISLKAMKKVYTLHKIKICPIYCLFILFIFYLDPKL